MAVTVASTGRVMSTVSCVSTGSCSLRMRETQCFVFTFYGIEPKEPLSFGGYIL